MIDKQTNRSQTWFHPDVPKAVRSHLLGAHHTARHRYITGGIIMIVGVSMVKLISPMISSHIVHIFLDVVGYSLHGIGLIPMIKAFEGGKP
jgi:hypothetical protein